MKITTAWGRGDKGPWLVASFDEATADYMGQPPLRYSEALEDAASNRYEVRELVLNVPESAIESLFTTPEVEATAGEGS